MAHAELRIIAGSLRGRKLHANVHPGLRPTPLMVREALFSILGHAVPDRLFIDLFAGTGINGLEALSRGASKAIFVERDGRLADAIDDHLKSFQLSASGRVVRGDVYRWAERWRSNGEAVNVYLSPPFADLTYRIDEFISAVAALQKASPLASVLIIQLEEGFDLSQLPDPSRWDVRTYGRNILAFWEPAEESETQIIAD